MKKEAEKEKRTLIVEHDETIDGLRRVVIFTSMGHRCGYVGVGEGHPLFGISYNEGLPKELTEKWEKAKEGPIGKRGAIDLLCLDPDNPRTGILFDVHGGITYSGSGKDGYPVEDERWYFGFDCAHCDDEKDFAAAEEYGIDISFLLRFEPHGGIVRSKQYVIDECNSLANQLSTLC